MSRNPPADRRHSHRHSITSVLAVLGIALLCAACGGGSARRAQVASMSGRDRDHGSGNDVQQGIPDPDGRPRETLDEDSQQVSAMVAPFERCVLSHHVLPKDGGYDARLRAASSACIKLEPLPAWPLDPTNPQSRSFIGGVVTCLQKKGYHARAAEQSSPFGLRGWTVDYTPPAVAVERTTEHAQSDCQHETTR